jgi:DNA invertase Pin-like site-specific DNA recombinase
MSSIEVQVNLDELNVVRRKLSFQFNKDFTQEETIQFLIEKEYKVSVKIPIARKPRHSVEKSDITKTIYDGCTYSEAMKKLGISKSTFFRYKRKERNLLEASE